MAESFARIQTRFKLYISLLRSAGIPIFMKHKSWLYLVLQILLDVSGVSTLITSWLNVLEMMGSVTDMMATMRISIALLMVYPLNFHVRFQIKQYERLLEMTDKFTWEELPSKNAVTGEYTAAGAIALIHKIVKYFSIGSFATHFAQSFYRIFVKHEFLFPISCPIFDCDSNPLYGIANISHILASAHAGLALCGIMGLYCTLAAIACSQFEKLKTNISNIYQKENSFATMESKLHNCVRHHQQILEFLEEMDEVFSPQLFMVLFLMMTALCIAAFSAVISWGDMAEMIQSILLYIIWMSSICIICWSGNEMTVKAESVREAAYGGDWIGTPISFQRTILLIITRTNKTFSLEAGKFIPVNNETMMKILNQTLSLFMFLLEMKDKSTEENLN